MDSTYDLPDYNLFARNFSENVSTTTATPSTPYLNTAASVTWVEAILSIFICFFGLVGNTIVIFIIVVLQEYRKSVTHWYVLQLAFADSLFLLTLPFYWVEDINGRWIYTEGMCKAQQTILFLNYYASIILLMIMSVDRYIAVCRTVSNLLQSLRKKQSAIIITIAAWVLALICCAPVMMYSTRYGVSPHCTCRIVFPKDNDIKNMTERCIEDGYTEENMEDCFKTLELLKGENGSTEYCIVEDENFLEKLSRSDGSGDDGNIADNSQGNGNLSSEYNFENNYIFDYASDSEIFNLSGNIHNSSVDQRFATDCFYNDYGTKWTFFLLFNFIAMFVLPVVVMTICYGLILKRLSASSLRVRNSVSGSLTSEIHSGRRRKRRRSSTKSDKNRKRVTIMCAALVSSFIVLWLPYHVGHLAKLVGIPLPEEKAHICNNLAVAGRLLVYLNSALNPYLYSFLATSFKRRWQTATATVRKSVRSRINSGSESLSVRYTRRSRRSREASTSNNTSTVETRITKTRRSTKTSLAEKKTDMDPTSAAFVTDAL